jgi:hypothetical protein
LGDGGAEGEEEDPMERRDFIGAAAAIAVGANAEPFRQWLPRVTGSTVPPPAQIGASEIDQVRTMTRQLRALDQQFGGGAALDAVNGYLPYARGLLTARCTEATRNALRLALADLYSLAGWALHDMNRHTAAKRTLLQGLVLARAAGEETMAAALLHGMGKISQNQELPEDALQFFQLARMRAQAAGHHAAMAVLHADEAWTYALLHQPKQVADSLALAEHERGLASADDVAAGGLDAVVAGQSPDRLAHQVAYCGGTALVLLAGHGRQADTRSAEQAVQMLSPLTTADSPGRVRAFDQISLAGSLLRAGERDAGITAANAAVDYVVAQRSARLTDRLRLVTTASNAYPRHPDAVELRHRITKVTVS